MIGQGGRAEDGEDILTDLTTDAAERFQKWFDGLERYAGGAPAKGTISGALVVLERLKTNYDLDIDTHTAKGGAQIIGASGEAVKRLLADFGETRPFVSEGGRTNRGLRGAIGGLLQTLAGTDLTDAPEADRKAALTAMQETLVEAVRDFHNRQRLKIGYDPNKSTWQLVRELLAAADETKRAGPVAQYLVGAKLQLRFPDLTVSNESYSTADVQLGRQGDFLLGDTAFHVTVAPMPGVFQKCRANLQSGYRPFLIVPDGELLGARQNLRAYELTGRVAVESIESFVSQNLEELAGFARDQRAHSFRRLLDAYNSRVNAVEIDKSLMIDVPDNLPAPGP